MNYNVYIIILLIVFVIIFKNIFINGEEHYTIITNDSDNIYLSTNMDRFDGYYNTYPNPYSSNSMFDYFNGYGCTTPYCRRSWYNRYTPFVWNNPGRYPYYYPPLYSLI